VNLSGKDIFWLSITGLTGYLFYRVFHLGESLDEAWAHFWNGPKFWEGLTFNPATLGPPVQSTPGAAAAQNEWIKLGYLELLPDGSTQITPAGDAYIMRQKEKIVTGKIVN